MTWSFFHRMNSETVQHDDPHLPLGRIGFALWPNAPHTHSGSSKSVFRTREEPLRAAPLCTCYRRRGHENIPPREWRRPGRLRDPPRRERALREPQRRVVIECSSSTIWICMVAHHERTCSRFSKLNSKQVPSRRNNTSSGKSRTITARRRSGVAPKCRRDHFHDATPVRRPWQRGRMPGVRSRRTGIHNANRQRCMQVPANCVDPHGCAAPPPSREPTHTLLEDSLSRSGAR
ncbi:hypothetical protein C8Q70DRAFT_296925 [Cubamyces menziesii]|nr:hypothetical protein C8Q70DRAFT_296925 [Cubamyces menziesii]